ncbi:uncharacterized protein LOC134821989 [Bolinopsis microptera]|uniref:uncharacterized protein LOC134821989 n=1 Tax=Bolinopsis microptera TaxID=2820187 RepID=UPI0030797D64
MNNDVMTDTMAFSVTVYKDVVATITPSSEETITYHEDKTITCKVEGGLSPHQVDLILPNLGTKTWKKDGSVESLSCSGEHVLTCIHTFTPEYDSDGDYKCKGYNEGRSGQRENKSEIKLTTVRQTQVNVLKETISVLNNGVIEVDCIIVGKPLVDITSVTWTHSKDLDFDLSKSVTIVKGKQDDFTLNSTLRVKNPLTTYTGTFNCNVVDHDGETISKAVNVYINNREFLEPPKVTYNDAEFIETGSQISITCLVQGFPAPSASLTYEGQYSMLETTERQSRTSTKLVFSVTTTCDYLNLNFSCNVKTTTSSEVLKASTEIVGPSITGCESNPKQNIGVLISSGVAVLFFITSIVAGVYILRSRRNQNSSSAGNVVYANAVVSKLKGGELTMERMEAEVITLSGHNYDNVVLHVTPEEATYVNTIAGTSPTTGHVYNDVVIRTVSAPDDTPYDYARNEDIIRHNIKEPTIYHNHELK